jgi:hypothetical protein
MGHGDGEIFPAGGERVSVRLLPWAAFAGAILAMAVLAALPGKVAVAPAAGAGQVPAAGPEIRLAAVDVREFHDGGGEGNRLTADRGTYEYAQKTVTGTGVTAFLAEKALRGTTVSAPSASWDFDRATLLFREGARLGRADGWTAELSAATLDMAGQTMRVPGAATLRGPGIDASGRNLVWEWKDGKITMDSPRGRIQPAAASRRRG